jgi:hypothetical protein
VASVSVLQLMVDAVADAKHLGEMRSNHRMARDLQSTRSIHRKFGGSYKDTVILHCLVPAY